MTAEIHNDDTQTDGANQHARIDDDGGTPREGMYSNAGEGHLFSCLYTCMLFMCRITNLTSKKSYFLNLTNATCMLHYSNE